MTKPCPIGRAIDYLKDRRATSAQSKDDELSMQRSSSMADEGYSQADLELSPWEAAERENRFAQYTDQNQQEKLLEMSKVFYIGKLPFEYLPTDPIFFIGNANNA